jgi:hypothetical protein
LVNLASRHAVPATFSNRDFAEIGGLMSYGTNIADAFRQVGVYDSPDLPAPQGRTYPERPRMRGNGHVEGHAPPPDTDFTKIEGYK